MRRVAGTWLVWGRCPAGLKEVSGVDCAFPIFSAVSVTCNHIRDDFVYSSPIRCICCWHLPCQLLPRRSIKNPKHICLLQEHVLQNPFSWTTQPVSTSLNQSQPARQLLDPLGKWYGSKLVLPVASWSGRSSEQWHRVSPDDFFELSTEKFLGWFCCWIWWSYGDCSVASQISSVWLACSMSSQCYLENEIRGKPHIAPTTQSSSGDCRQTLCGCGKKHMPARRSDVVRLMGQHPKAM